MAANSVQYFAVLCLLLASATCVNSDYIFSIRLLSLINPNEQLAAGGLCCEVEPNLNVTSVTVCPQPCNTTLQICIRGTDHPMGDFTCSTERLIVAAQQLPIELNPVTVGPWPGSIQLYISAVHDLTGLLGSQSPNIPVIGELIDDFLLNVSISPSLLSASEEMELIGTFNRTMLRVSFDVTCTFDYYGPDCNTFCPGSRNDSSGHLTCDLLDGSIVCLKGYQTIESNCTVCVPLEGCSSQGGVCNFPGECTCREGYSGPLCSTFGSPPTFSSGIQPPVISSNVHQLQPTMTAFPRAASSTAAVIGDLGVLSTTHAFTVSQSSSTVIITSVLLQLDFGDNGMVSTTQQQVVLVSSSTPNLEIGFIEPTTDPSSNRTIAYIVAGVIGSASLFIIIAITIIFIALSKSSVCGQQKRRIKRRNHFIDSEVIMNNEASNESVIINNHNATDNTSIATQGSLANSSYVRWNSPDPTYSTFVEGESEAAVVEVKSITSVLSDSNEDTAVEDCEEPIMEKEKMMKMDLSFQNVDDTGVSTFGFPNPQEEEMPIDLGEDLLSSIERSLTYSNHNGTVVFPSALSTNSQKSDHVLIQDTGFSSFIYSDMVDEDTLCTPSLSPDS